MTESLSLGASFDVGLNNLSNESGDELTTGAFNISLAYTLGN